MLAESRSGLKSILFAIVVSTLGLAAHRVQAEEISLSYTASTLTFLAGRVAVDQGFFRQEGLDVKFVQMRTAALIPALTNAHIDYTMSFLPPIDSALKGLPVQMVGVFVDRSLHYLVTRSTIKSPADLRGKTFAINAVDLNGSTGLVFQALMRHFGYEINKDVKWISAADSPALFAMVQQGWFRPGRRRRARRVQHVHPTVRRWPRKPGTGPPRAARVDPRYPLHFAARQ
jgi:ABC-type nitrate/sulfonate/bicarbonate transport system substrate-binding protein